MSDLNRPFERGAIVAKEYGPIVAYDFETTNIPALSAFPETDYDRAIATWRSECERWEQIRGTIGQIVPDYVRRSGRWTIAGEFADVPASFLARKAPARSALGDRRDGNLDEIADELGWAPAEVLDWARSRSRPPRKPERDKGIVLTIQPRYVTAFGGDRSSMLSRRLDHYEEVRDVIDDLWKNAENATRFVAFNANRFDLRILLYAALGSRYKVEPFMAKNSALRGAVMSYRNKRVYWLDAIAMLGLQCNLKTFLKIFAPQYEKLTLDFEAGSVFDADNPAHREYAEQDSIALYYALIEAEKVMRSLTGFPLQPTIGALGIRAFCNRMPAKTRVYRVPRKIERVLRDYVARGGFCYARRYRGPLWTYDQNQAYAGAMRSAKLPAGRCYHAREYDHKRPGVYRVSASHRTLQTVPFPMRAIGTGKLVEHYGEGELHTWLTSIEIELLRELGWTIRVHDGFAWSESFSMRAWVNGLEDRRKRFAKDHPVNVAVKAIGCNAYGKTMQQAPEWKFVMSLTQPKGGKIVYDGDAEIPGFWMIPENRLRGRCYERPQIGCFITAHVRCAIYRAAMTDPEHFVKADTDSVAFTRPQPQLPISPFRYGDWKLESDGDEHIVIGKKVYWSIAPDGPGSGKIVCKGLRVRELTRKDFERWYADRIAPVQEQVQLQTWKRDLRPSWKRAERRGTQC